MRQRLPQLLLAASVLLQAMIISILFRMRTTDMSVLNGLPAPEPATLPSQDTSKSLTKKNREAAVPKENELGIDKTLEVFDDITKLLVSSIYLYKGGIGLSTFDKLWGIIDAVKELVVDVPPAFPEIMDLDPEESGKLGTAAHKMLKEVARAVVE